MKPATTTKIIKEQQIIMQVIWMGLLFLMCNLTVKGFEPSLATDLEDSTQSEGDRAEEQPESRVGEHAEASHADERSDEGADDRGEQRDAIIPRFRTGANIFLSLAALACFCRCP